MIIRSVQVRNFRSIDATGLAPCEDLNVLIGKNNAGKSNLLTAISLLLSHLKSGKISAPWRTQRPKSEFHQRGTHRPIRIAAEFVLSADVNKSLRERLTQEAPHLDRSIDQVGSHDSIVFILAGVLDESDAYLFVEQIAVGKLKAKDDELLVDGIKLFSIVRPTARELFENVVTARNLSQDLDAIEALRAGRVGPTIDYIIQLPKERRGLALRRTIDNVRPETLRQVEAALASAATTEEATRVLTQILEELREKIEQCEKKETKGVISGFAGDTRVPPAYALWLMQQFGSIAVMHIREVKEQIGRVEAETLLRLKVRRGGPERLRTVQQTVAALLGVSLDAFESEARGESRAELDVDDFLVEANGAGIREALRLVLDLELKNPKLVLIEEPEVHLHPGLARAVAGYLKEKSQEIQMFLTTHSTEFVDFVPFQTVFLVSRDDQNTTSCHPIEAGDASLKLPSELGIRLSTVFMFDRLVFVEGPSDEAVLREFAKKLEIDLTKSNVGFVYMQGTRNFAYFAADATLDLLARRKIRMHFIVDRDEKDDADINAMMQRLGDRSALAVFRKREIENYLLDPEAIGAFVEEKSRLAGSTQAKPDANDVREAIETEAIQLKDEVVRLRLEKRILKPIFLHTRTQHGSIESRLKAAAGELSNRQKTTSEIMDAIKHEVEAAWPDQATNLAPGSIILEKVVSRFGAKFSKDRGDSERLARMLQEAAIATELRTLLQDIVRD
jgi:energy-coupling factor transporter ATP-binding protein EcfA2